MPHTLTGTYLFDGGRSLEGELLLTELDNGIVVENTSGASVRFWTFSPHHPEYPNRVCVLVGGTEFVPDDPTAIPFEMYTRNSYLRRMRRRYTHHSYTRKQLIVHSNVEKNNVESV